MLHTATHPLLLMNNLGFTRSPQGLKIVGTNNITRINSTETFELYYIAGMDLKTNPIAENAKDLRDQAVVCDIKFEAYNDAVDSETSYIENLISTTNDTCELLNICGVGDCDQVTDDDCDPVTDESCVIDGYSVSH